MTDSQALRIVEKHNRWRRGAEIPMEDPKTLGLALERVIALARTACPKKQRHKPCNGIGCGEWVLAPSTLCPACLDRLARVSRFR